MHELMLLRDTLEDGIKGRKGNRLGYKAGQIADWLTVGGKFSLRHLRRIFVVPMDLLVIR